MALGIAGQAVAQDDYSTGWIVVKDGVSIERSDIDEEEFTSLNDIQWDKSRFFLPKGTLKPGGLEYMFFYDENGFCNGQYRQTA